MRLHDLPDWLGITIIISTIVGACLLAMYACGWVVAGIRLGQTYNTVGTIQMYEHSSFCGEHTWVVIKTLGGIEASFKLVDYHEFELGEQYSIRTTSVRGGWGGLDNWYKVNNIEKL